MKRTISKIFCVIMALCVFVTILPMSVSAEEVELTVVEPVSMIEFSPETELDPPLNINMNKFYSDGTVDSYKLHNQIHKYISFIFSYFSYKFKIILTKPGVQIFLHCE